MSVGAFCAALLSMASCKEDDPLRKFESNNYYNFSLKQFILDQWTTHAGEPISFRKIVRINDKTDTSYTNVDVLDWRPIVKEFADADISDSETIRRYTFSQFDDDYTQSHNLLYKAISKKQHTQQLLVTVDNRTGKVTGIFAETLEKTFWNEREQKLVYLPMNTIQIQQYDKPLMGSKKEMVITYQVK